MAEPIRHRFEGVRPMALTIGPNDLSFSTIGKKQIIVADRAKIHAGDGPAFTPVSWICSRISDFKSSELFPFRLISHHLLTIAEFIA